MTREQKLHKLILAGAPKFSRAPSRFTSDVVSLAESKPLPDTADSGLSHCPKRNLPSEGESNEDQGDYGVASVIHVIEPDASGARHWWHTKGFSSDPYSDGSLPLPTFKESNAAREARESTQKIAKARDKFNEESIQLDTETTSRRNTLRPPGETFPPSSDSLKSNDDYRNIGPIQDKEGLNGSDLSDNTKTRSKFKAVPLNLIGSADDLKDTLIPRNVIHGEAFTENLLKTYNNTSLARVNLYTLISSNNIPPDESNVNRLLIGKGTCRDQSNLKDSKVCGKLSVEVAYGHGLGERKSLSNTADGGNTGKKQQSRINSNSVQIARPVVQTANRGPTLKSTSKANRDNGTTDQGQKKGSHNRDGGGKVTTPLDPKRKPTRPGSTHIYEGVYQEGQKISHLHENESKDKRASSPVIIRSQTPSEPLVNTQVIKINRRYRSKSQSSTPETSCKSQFKRSSSPALTLRDRRGKSALKCTTVSQDQYQSERPKSSRKVCFSPDNELADSTMDRKLTGVVIYDPQPALNPPMKKTKRTRTAPKWIGKPTQRTIDNNAIFDVAQANKNAMGDKKRVEEESKKGGKESRGSSDSELENEENCRVSKSAWQIFEEQVKSIDDGNITFSPRDLTSKSSDLFEKVMCEVGPQFRSPAKSDYLELGEDLPKKELEKTVLTRKNSSMSTKNKSKRGWTFLRETMMDVRKESGKADEASLNWKFLCTTINNMTDMEKGREALYQKYIYYPNSWMKGFKTPPTTVLKQGQKSKESAHMRKVQSANGFSTVVIGHQGQATHKFLPATAVSMKRVTSTSSRIQVAPYSNNMVQSFK